MYNSTENSSGRGSSISGSYMDDHDAMLNQEAPMNIQYPLQGAWGATGGIRTPRSARSTLSAASSNRSATPKDELKVTPADE